MYEKVNITENSLRVLSLFTQGFDKAYYIREVHKILSLSPRTAQVILEDLEEKGIIQSKSRGNIKEYRLQHNAIARRYLTLAEQYKTICFLEKRPIIQEIIEKITPHITGIGIVFGSYVKETQHENSDLDVFIVGTYVETAIRTIAKKYGIYIQVKNYSLEIFKKAGKNDVLIQEVLKNHVIFTNTEQCIAIVLDDG